MKVIQGLYSGVTTVELDTLAAETAATLTTKHPDYAILAARIAVSNLHKETKKMFSGEAGAHVVGGREGAGLPGDLNGESTGFPHLSVTDVMDDLYNYVNPNNGKHSPMISKETLDIVLANKDVRNFFFLLHF